MATSNTSFRVAELDFDSIKANLKTFLRSQSQFQDYDFDGSSMSILIDVLAYNTHYMAFFQNMLANESFLDSAVIRDSITSLAKMLGYTPKSRTSSTANVSIIITPPLDNNTSVLTLPKYTTFSSEAIDGQNFTFLTIGSYTATKNNISNNFVFPAVDLKQGEYITTSFVVDTSNPQSRFIIPNQNVDTTTLSVSVQASSLDSSLTVFSESDDITELGPNTTSYFLEASSGMNYAVYFGDGYLGKSLSNGNIVILEYVVTDGELANKANVFTSSGSIYGFSNVSISTNSLAGGGAEPETDDQIKHRAPIAYTSQNRAVTKSDHETIIGHDYPSVDQISVWGGEDNDPKVYGKVFISMKPKEGFVLTNAEKARITSEILANRNIITVTPVIVDPIYTYLLTKIKVYYDASATLLNSDEIASLVRTNIIAYCQNQIGKFNTPFRASKLQTVIDNSELSIQNSDMVVTLQKRLVPTIGQSLNYDANFNTEIKRGSPEEKIFSYPIFVIADANGISRETYLEEVPFSYTGIERIDVLNPGRNFTSTPDITITGDGTGATAFAKIINGKISSITVGNRGSDYSRAFAIISGGNGVEADVSCVLSTKFGTLRLFYYKDSGEKVIINDDIGTIDYALGKISLLNFKPLEIKSNPVYDDGILVINASPISQTITPVRNNIITIDITDPLSCLVTAIAI